jgi:hypothetical protein
MARTRRVLGVALHLTCGLAGHLGAKAGKVSCSTGDALLAGWSVLLAGSRYATWCQVGGSSVPDHAVTYLSPAGRARRPLGQPVRAGQEYRGGRRNRCAPGAVAATAMTPRGRGPVTILHRSRVDNYQAPVRAQIRSGSSLRPAESVAFALVTAHKAADGSLRSILSDTARSPSIFAQFIHKPGTPPPTLVTSPGLA